MFCANFNEERWHWGGDFQRNQRSRTDAADRRRAVGHEGVKGLPQVAPIDLIAWPC